MPPPENLPFLKDNIKKLSFSLRQKVKKHDRIWEKTAIQKAETPAIEQEAQSESMYLEGDDQNAQNAQI